VRRAGPIKPHSETIIKKDVRMKVNKQFIAGIIVGVILSITFTAVAASKIKSAEYKDWTISYNGQNIPLSSPFIGVVDEEKPNDSVTYMPIRTVLEYLGYIVGLEGTNVTLTNFVTLPATVPSASDDG